MGWFRDSHPGHEGYVVGYVEREGVTPGSRLVRELAYPTDPECREDLVLLGAGCDCGWRSPYFEPRLPASWGPWSVLASERDEAIAEDLWANHIDHTST